MNSAFINRYLEHYCFIHNVTYLQFYWLYIAISLYLFSRLTILWILHCDMQLDLGIGLRSDKWILVYSSVFGILFSKYWLLITDWVQGVILNLRTWTCFLLNRHSPEAVANAREKKEGVTEDGIEDAFDLVGEVSLERCWYSLKLLTSSSYTSMCVLTLVVRNTLSKILKVLVRLLYLLLK